MKITTVEHIIKAIQADRIDGVIMLYSVNCLYCISKKQLKIQRKLIKVKNKRLL